jgi:hypothetical protein
MSLDFIWGGGRVGIEGRALHLAKCLSETRCYGNNWKHFTFSSYLFLDGTTEALSLCRRISYFHGIVLKFRELEFYTETYKSL